MKIYLQQNQDKDILIENNLIKNSTSILIISFNLKYY